MHLVLNEGIAVLGRQVVGTRVRPRLILKRISVRAHLHVLDAGVSVGRWHVCGCSS